MTDHALPPPADDVRRLLLITGSNAGDVIHATPLIATLRRLYADAEIVLLVAPNTEELVIDHPDLDQVLTLPAAQPGESRLGAFLRGHRWRRRLAKEQFDLVIALDPGDDALAIAQATKARVRVGWAPEKPGRGTRAALTHAVPAGDAPRHAVLRNLHLLALADADQVREARVDFEDTELSRVDTLLRVNGREESKPLAWIHPAARYPYKCWTTVGMRAVIEHLGARGYDVVLTSGPDHRERYMVRTIRDLCRCPHPPIDLSGRLTLREIAALAHRADLYFGVDATPMHVAAAMGTPVIAILGPTPAARLGPWPNGWRGADTPYPANRGAQHAGAHLVVQMDWDCVACAQAGCRNRKKSRCLDELEAEDVLPRLDAALNRLQVGHEA